MPGTLVDTQHGKRVIESLKEGDLVWAKDESTGEIALKPIAQTFERVAPSTLVLTFSNGETIETTVEHPFYVQDRGFVPAGLVALGNSIVTRAGPSLQVTGIEKHSSPHRVYNFSVEDYHTYFVGNSALWVHNANYKEWPNQMLGSFDEEMETARRLGATRVQLGQGDWNNQLRAFAQQGTTLKWVVSPSGEVRVVASRLPDATKGAGLTTEISHAFALGDRGSVVAAGSAKLGINSEGQVFLKYITNITGHYKVSEGTRKIGAGLFKEFVEVSDDII